MARVTGGVLIAAGGTGGHMFPALALGRALQMRGCPVTLVTDSRGARYIGRSCRSPSSARAARPAE